MLQLRTFGGLSVHEDGAPCRGAAVRRKTLALLALLAAADKNGASRDKLIAFLWPESDTEHGRNLLRQACFALRRDLHHHELILGATELRLNPEAVSSDLRAFADALKRGDLAGAVALYGGPFLDGFYLRGSDEFERWAETERGRLAKQVCAVLEALATQALAGADHRAAEQWWHRLAALDPLSSHAALGLMTALAAGGDRAGAIRHARVHEAMLRRKLGTAPEAAVTRLAERLRAEAAPPESSEAAPALAGHTVGREAERGELRAGLASALAGRSVMLCVSGEPGIGKTTLVESFLGEVTASDRLCWIARGRCSERLAGAEAYLPFLEALEGLTHSDPRASAARLMQDVAPNWYAQVAPLSPEGSPRGELQAASQDRLKRELSTFLLELARLRPLIVFFEDLHWADASTVDLLGPSLAGAGRRATRVSA